VKKAIKLLEIIIAVIIIGVTFICCDELLGINKIDENGDENSNGNNDGGSTIINPKFTIKNNTGFRIGAVWLKPSNSVSWGWQGYNAYMSDEQSREFTLSQPLSANSVYDIRLSEDRHYTDTPIGYRFIKYRVTISNGMTLTFSTNDLNNESDLPTITILNRVGVSLNACYIKTSASNEWGANFESISNGTNFGSISNNGSLSVTLPILPSSYSTIDIHTTSTNPNNTYTKKNVPVTNGLVIIYTRANSDSPLTGAPVIVIQNNTGFYFGDIWIKPSNSTDWVWQGYNEHLSDGELRTLTLSLPMSNQYDIRLSESRHYTGTPIGYIFSKSNIAVSDGMIITFTGSDLEE